MNPVEKGKKSRGGQKMSQDVVWSRRAFTAFCITLILISSLFGMAFYSWAAENPSAGPTLLQTPIFNVTNELWYGTENRTGVISHPERSTSYILWNDTSTNDIYAKNCTSGQIDFGGSWDAGGIDGANASSVIQAVIDLLSLDNRGGVILLKEGHYYIKNTITVTGKYLTFNGEGRGNTNLLLKADMRARALRPSVLRKGIEWESLIQATMCQSKSQSWPPTERSASAGHLDLIYKYNLDNK